MCPTAYYWFIFVAYKYSYPSLHKPSRYCLSSFYGIVEQPNYIRQYRIKKISYSYGNFIE